RGFAAEERTGTLELLLTAPVSRGSIIAGKLGGLVSALVVLAIGTAVCPLLVVSMGRPDSGPILTGYVGLVLAGLAFVSVGLAVSATTASPVVAAGGTGAVLLGLLFCGLLSGGLTGGLRSVLEYVSPSSHVT